MKKKNRELFAQLQDENEKLFFQIDGLKSAVKNSDRLLNDKQTQLERAWEIINGYALTHHEFIKLKGEVTALKIQLEGKSMDDLPEFEFDETPSKP
jgi:hypothetical protein